MPARKGTPRAWYTIVHPTTTPKVRAGAAASATTFERTRMRTQGSAGATTTATIATRRGISPSHSTTVRASLVPPHAPG